MEPAHCDVNETCINFEREESVTDRLRQFLQVGSKDWFPGEQIRRFLLPSNEFIACIFWKDDFYISGTDILRILTARFQDFGRDIENSKKFEEGIFSELRGHRSGHNALLEEPRSPFLNLLFQYECIRTKKKQKVFQWSSVKHDELFLVSAFFDPPFSRL